MKISIVLLTFTEIHLINQCLEYLLKYADSPYELIVINVGSDKEIVTMLQNQAGVRLVTYEENIGIARAYNAGLNMTECDYVLFLSQYSLITENSISSMLECLNSADDIAMVGPVSNEVSGDQHLRVEYRDLSQMKAFTRTNQTLNRGVYRRTFRLLSHCLLVKKDVLDNIGGFDERFCPGGYEDDDLCLRLINEGYKLYIALEAFVHYVNPLKLQSFDAAGYLHQLSDNRAKAIDKWGFDIPSYLLRIKVPITITLCMIVKNEEAVLERCLNCIKEIVDEIVIIDTGSTDRTKVIAYQYTEKVYDFEWIDDFSAARNYSFQHATMQYVLWLDADDIIDETNQAKFAAIKHNLDASTDAVTMLYNLGFDQYGNVTATNRRHRLVRRSNNYRWVGAVHEYLAVWGQVVDSDIAITHCSEGHDSDRNINIYKKRLKAGEVFAPRDQYYFANELMDHKQYKPAIKWYQKFLAGGQGWVEDKLGACRNLAQCCAQLGKNSEAMQYVLQSFLYDQPRAEFCCQMGMYFINEGQINPAIFWFNLATQLKPPAENKGFLNPSFWTWVPHLQLCVCYDRLGQYDLADKHNEIAAEYVPNDPSVLHNREYLKSKFTED